MKRWFGGLDLCAAHAASIVIVVTLLSSASLAQGTRAQRLACTGDVWRLCSSAIPSVDRIVACLKRERARLSPGCQAVFNDPEVQSAINRSPAGAPNKAGPHAQPEHAASATSHTPHIQPEPEHAANTTAAATPHAQPEQAATTIAEPAPHAKPDQAASTTTTEAPTPSGTDSASAERPDVVTRSLQVTPPEEVASAVPPVQSAGGWKVAAAVMEPVASRDVELMTRDRPRHGRQQREADQSAHHRRSGTRYGGGMMAQIAPLVAMAMGGGQGGGGGFDGQGQGGGYGGRNNFDVGQIMGMARSMGFDSGTFMGGGGWR